MQDPIVEEIRRIRQEYARRFNYDSDAIFEDLKEKERTSRRTIVRRQSRPPKTVTPRK